MPTELVKLPKLLGDCSPRLDIPGLNDLMLGLNDLAIRSGVSKSDPLGLRDSVSKVVSMGGGRKIDAFFVFRTIPGGGSMLVDAERFCGTNRAAY